MNGCIYVIEGNNQVYVGATCRNLRQRYFEHKYGAFVGRLNRSASCFWGDEPPTIRCIQKMVNTDAEKMKKREKYYINKLYCTNKLNNANRK